MNASKKLRLVVVLATLCVVSVAVGVGAYRSLFSEVRWTASNVAQSKESAAKIIAAIEQYRSRNGRAPGRLEDLCPSFLEVIPRPSAGLTKWRYQRTTQRDYVLKFCANANDYPASWYDSADGAWHLDQ